MTWVLMRSVRFVSQQNCIAKSRRHQCNGPTWHRRNLSNSRNSPRKSDWLRAISDAEKVVGYSTSYLSLRCLLSDEISNIASHLRKLVGSNHPLLKTAKSLIYNGRHNMLTRGLIILLVSKVAGFPSNEKEHSTKALISQRQRSLAEITEMVHTAYLIHKGIVNISSLEVSESISVQDMEFGNKIAILSGDYLLANACLGLSSLRNSKVVELMSSAIRDFTESEFLEAPSKATTSEFSVDHWEKKHFLSSGSLLAKSCQGALELAGHSEEKQKKAFEFGKQMALVWQIFSELQSFTNGSFSTPRTALSLSSIPVILHLEGDSSDMKYFLEHKDDMKEVDYKKIFSAVNKGEGIAKARQLCDFHAQKALKILDHFKESEAQRVLKNILHSFQE